MSISISKGLKATTKNARDYTISQALIELEKRTDNYECLKNINRVYGDIDGKNIEGSKNEFDELDMQTKNAIELFLENQPHCLMTASSFLHSKISWRFVLLDVKTTLEENKQWVILNLEKISLPHGIVFDSSVYSKNQKMRMFGSNKDGENRPLILVKGEPIDTLISYIPDDCQTAIIPIPKKKVNKVEHLENILLEKIVMNIRNDVDWEQWYKIAQAIFNEGGSESLFLKWSAQSSKHNESEARQQWHSLKVGDGSVLSAGSLIHWSSESNIIQHEKIMIDFVKETNTVPSGINIDDAFAAKFFANLMGSHILLDSVVWVFDIQTGIWDSSEAHISRVITQCGAKLCFIQGEKKYNYSGIVGNTKNLMIKLPSILPKNDGYMRSRVMSDVGKILFPNGIYDFKTKIFTKEFDSNIVFRCAMPRAFPERNQIIIDEIRKVSFVESFDDEESREILLHQLMRASIGDVSCKKYTNAIGPTNSGKGMLTKLCITGFGSYCATFNGDSLLARTEGGESSREMGWISDIANSRFAFSSEIRTNDKKTTCINGNMLKTITSGGDEIKTRRLYANDISIVNKSSLFIFANDMPKISPVDDAIRERTIAINWSHSYVDEPKLIYERKKDTTLCQKYDTSEYGDAFFWLLVDEYEKWRTNKFIEMKTPECVLQGRDELMPIISISEVLSEKYEITNSPFDFVPYTQIVQWLKENEVLDSDTKIGRELTLLGLKTKNVKVDRKAVKCRIGLKELV